MISEKKFSSLIKRASQPLQSSEKTKKSGTFASSSGKQTRQRNAGDTSGKRRDKSRE